VWRRCLAVVALGALAATAACGSSGPRQGAGSAASGAAQSGTLTIWTLQDPALNPILQKAVDVYQRTSKVKITVNSVQNDTYRQKLRVAMGSANQPDVFFNWGGGSIRDYVTAGQLADLSPALNADAKWRDSFLPSVLKAGQIDGKYYGIPLRGMQPVILFYNKKVFADAGAQPPATWDDLLGLVDTFKGKGVTPIALAGKQPWCELMYLEYLVDRIGGPQVFDKILKNGPDAWSDPAVLQSLQKIRQLVDKGAFGTNYKAIDFNAGGSDGFFAKGKAAMQLQGSWEFANQVDGFPKFARTDLAWTPFPTVPGGTGDPNNVVGNPTNYFSVNNASKNKQAAIDFLKQSMSGDAYVSDLIQAGDVPTVTGVDAKLQSGPNPAFTSWQFQMVQKAPDFTLSWDQAVKTDLGETLVNNLQKVFNKTMSPEQYVVAMNKASQSQ
jgi:xylobiose transport system substrate-binding protein